MSSSSARAQSQARAAPAGPVDTKSKQDGNPGGKPGKSAGGSFPRAAKRREPTNSSFAAANPPRRSPAGSAAAAGGYGAVPRHCPPSHSRWNPPAAAAADFFAVDEADEFEVGSLYKAGSKKQSLNHLLNFQFAPRPGSEAAHRHPNGRGAQRHNSGKFRGYQQQQQQQASSARPAYRKEHYLQANCQFVVKARADYSRHESDPDLLVDWDLIEQVRLRTSGSEPTSCPICLFPPTAGKISRCGHVFCWPCILHYLALSDDNWRKCPICYESIQKTDLRSVATVQQANYATGGHIEMRLMQRERNSLLAVPVGQEVDKDDVLQLHVKLIKASRAQVAGSILAEERRELEFQYAVEADQPESCFIQEALALLAARELEEEEDEGIVVSGGPVHIIPGMFCVDAPAKGPTAVVMANPSATTESLDDLIQLTADLTSKTELGQRHEEPCGRAQEDDGQAVAAAASWRRPRHASSGSDLSSEGEDLCLAEVDGPGAEITAEDLDISAVQPSGQACTSYNSAEKPAPKNIFYFYQSSDGQPIFLHALNVQMLVAEYGSLQNCPTVIRASILEKDSSTMTEDLRDRLRYLRHLPVASSFEVAELELVEPVVSKATVAKFRDQLEGRRRKRARKQREERRRERRIEAEENRLMGRFPGPMVRIESAYHYPLLGDQPLPPSAVDRRRQGASSPAESAEGSVGTASPDLGTSPAASASALSFAKIIRDGVARPGAVRPVSGRSTAPHETTGASHWRNSGSEDGGEGGEGWAAPPTASLGDALAAALARAGTTDPANANNKKKGKKGRAILVSGGAVRPRL